MTNKPKSDQTKSFPDVFRAELKDIRERRIHTKRVPLDEQIGTPSISHSLTGLALSGGGIRSASFSLGVLQGLAPADAIRHMDYLSTVSGGGYIGTSMTTVMSTNGGLFPFARAAGDAGETPETKHLRDNARYLIPNGIWSVLAAIAVYLRGIAMNALVLLPFLLLTAALIVLVNPDTKTLVTPSALDSVIEMGGMALFFCWAAFAVFVSITPIAALEIRHEIAMAIGALFAAYALTVVFALQPHLLLAYFQEKMLIAPPKDGAPLEQLLSGLMHFISLIGPAVLIILPFVKKLGVKATAGDAGGWGDFSKKIASWILLLFAAVIVPLALWAIMMQFAFWGTAVSTCEHNVVPPTECPVSLVNNWDHAPAPLRNLIEAYNKTIGVDFLSWAVPSLYALGALLLFFFWPFLSVNANSLHQLYRDRLGRAFLIKHDKTGACVSADNFALTKIDTTLTPYHLINASLNVPGSEHANRRGRNADFFLFSKRFIGSEVTGYIGTEVAETVADRLNIGTAMAISGAAVAPNMGTASIKPLSPTLAFLNLRLGRWILHPSAIANRVTRNKVARGGRPDPWLLRIPGPRYLLREAFAKSGLRLTKEDSDDHIRTGFVFLTDGGHLENLGIYELLRRRCRLILAVDAEQDPKLTFPALVQLQRFARTDLNVIISMFWQPLADRALAFSTGLRSSAGPHVALGLISYPPSTDRSTRENHPPLTDGDPREKGILVYIKASFTGDENDYVRAYKAAHPSFPHETTGDQFFSEEQVEVYRALGEHIARRFVTGLDEVAIAAADHQELVALLREMLPSIKMSKKGGPTSDVCTPPDAGSPLGQPTDGCK